MLRSQSLSLLYFILFLLLSSVTIVDVPAGNKIVYPKRKPDSTVVIRDPTIAEINTWKKSTSFPGSLFLPPIAFKGKKRDPGKEVGKKYIPYQTAEDTRREKTGIIW